jgi:hypothetical protein
MKIFSGGFGAAEAEVEEVGENLAVDMGAVLGQRVVSGEGIGGAGVGPGDGPIGGPVAIGVDGGVGG